ncbi:MAG: DUF2950 domain-containing protein [Steroidobacteraceae bacterium]
MNISSLMPRIAVAALLCFGLCALAQAAQQKTFATPEDAVVALVESTLSGNKEELLAILGPEGQKVLFSGDPVMDQRNRDVFLVAYGERAALMEVSPTSRVLYVGYEDWPMPIPLVKEGDTWRFDTAAGAHEILFRRIGRNELSTIALCQAYVEAQQEYAAIAHDGKSTGVYAQKIASTKGKHDGLYWKSEDPEELSPLGELAAAASLEGYGRGAGQATPFHGYLFRILTDQGKSALGGERSYIINGEMRDGFALIAYPAAYRVSGVMSFIVNQDGVVYQKDLGPETEKIAAAIIQFDPDPSWQKVE